MTIQQKLENRLYELLPHKKELEFGCWILDRKDNIQKRIAGSNGEERVLIKGIGEIEKYKLLDICDFEIIGQPLRLADLLLAIEKVNKNNVGIFINQYGIFYKMIDEIQTDTLDPFIIKYKNLGYNLQDDNILNQSDKFCEFVYGLLK